MTGKRAGRLVDWRWLVEETPDQIHEISAHLHEGEQQPWLAEGGGARGGGHRGQRWGAAVEGGGGGQAASGSAGAARRGAGGAPTELQRRLEKGCHTLEV